MNSIRTLSLISGFSPCLRRSLQTSVQPIIRQTRILGSLNCPGPHRCVVNSSVCFYSSDSNSMFGTPVIKPIQNGSEKHYAHSVLETLDGYKSRIISGHDNIEANEVVHSTLDKIHSEEFDSSDPDRILGVLNELSSLSDQAKNALYQSTLFWEFCDILTNTLSQCTSDCLMSFMELIAQLGYWEKIPTQFKEQCGKLLSEIRKECAEKAENWSKGQLLFIMNFFCIFNTKVVPGEIYSRLESEVVNMTKEDVIQLLYFLSLFKSSDPGLLQELEDKLERIYRDFTDDELAVACLGFFRSQHLIRSEQIIGEMLDRLETNSPTMHEMGIVSLMKCVNYSLSRDVGLQDGLRTSFRNIMKNLYPRLEEFDNSTCMNLFRLCHSLRMMDHNLIDAMCQRAIKTGLGQWRLKDISFFLFRCASFQAMLAEKDWFYAIFVKELESSDRRAEFMHFPRCLLQALTGLAYVEIYPYDLINECLSPSYRKLLLEKSNVDPLRELIVLDQAMEIECPDYSGCRLPSDTINKVQNDPHFKKNTRLPHEKRRLSHRDQMLLDIQAQLEMLFGGDPVAELAFVLPHFQTADILMEVDEDKKICQLSEWVDREQARKGHKRLVLICASPNVYHIYQTDYGHSRKISGIHVMKRRQLQKLGYTVIEVPYFEWHKSNREFYLKKLLSTHVALE
ncbi:uncharacterized protein LOC135483221 [Lineus longissimus]|uniref:uncharacterized protein LOC135483221 n=1 Tax=Lineus longissimus TaxID=88925 RepID=UPI00315D174C